MKKEIKEYSLNKLIGIGFLLILGLTACSGATQPDPAQEPTQKAEIQATQPEPITRWKY